MTKNLQTATIAGVSAAISQIIIFFAHPWLSGYSTDGAPVSIGQLESALSVVVTAALSLLGPSLVEKLTKPKPGSIAMLTLLSLAPLNAHAQSGGRITLAERTVTSSTGDYEVAELRIAPFIIVNAVTIPLKRRAAFEAGVDVGGCYGLLWSPRWWDNTSDSPFAGFGACVEMGLVVNGNGSGPEGSNAFAVQAVGVIELMRWLQFGIGWRQRLTLSDGGRDNGEPVVTFGLTAVNF